MWHAEAVVAVVNVLRELASDDAWHESSCDYGDFTITSHNKQIQPPKSMSQI